MTVPAAPTGPGVSGCSTSFTPPIFCCSACWPIFSFRKEVFPLSHRNTRILSGCAALLLCAGLSGCRSVPASRPSASPDPAAHLLGLTAEQRMEDYEYLWSTLRDSYPCWGILEREGVEVERIYTTYREMVAESDSDADFYSAIYSALYLLGTNGHLSIIEPEAYFSDYLPAAGQYRREGNTHWAEVLDSTDTQTRYRKLLALEQAANGTDAESSIPGSGSDTPNLTTLLLPGGTTGYLKIDRFPADYTSDAAALEAFYLQCAGCTDLILDLTDNSGGSELYWEQLLVAPHIDHPLSSRHLALVRRSANNNPYLDEAFSPSAFRPLSTLPELPGLDAADRALATDVLTVSHTVEPAAKPSPFRGRIWVLVDESVYSASESFVLFCQQTGFATLVGRTTGGDGIGAMDPVYLQLPNSGILIQYTVPFGLNPDGSSNEEMGTTPDLVSPAEEPPLITAFRAIGEA